MYFIYPCMEYVGICENRIKYEGISKKGFKSLSFAMYYDEFNF